MTQSTSQITNVAETILRYIVAHPDACDSLEGICDWWLVLQRRHDTRCEVAGALKFLVEDGQLEASTGPDGMTVYRALRATKN